MEWINPKYAELVAHVQRAQAALPKQHCSMCDGRGERLVPEMSGASRVKCTGCEGRGTRPAHVRSWTIV
ncbi:hypothetical protein K7472_09945 [Streptomyces sp. PTM05]|uniref:Uncharacterized protein n=1 Tax=Streptantibioticus parmotrematis TaxID=2873249 RepID=A0ABS7QTP1_9ACTN|nr:hypothetical protein [Streptantibioticus parmotrematis]MBY8885164.1 hypothetical protein [Streptantibioticus parmotrematis]